MPRIELKTKINSTLEICFDLSRNIDLRKISTAKTKEKAVSRRTTGPINLNDTVTLKAKHFGLTQHLTSIITEFDRPKLFIDEQSKEIFKSIIHEHRFEEINNKVIITGIFKFQSPFGILGNIFNKLILTH